MACRLVKPSTSVGSRVNFCLNASLRLCAGSVEMMSTLLRTAAGPTVSYKPYNWKCAAIRYRTFEAANFRTNRSACTIS